MNVSTCRTKYFIIHGHLLFVSVTHNCAKKIFQDYFFVALLIKKFWIHNTRLLLVPESMSVSMFFEKTILENLVKFTGKQL